MRILLVDDHVLFRDSLRMLLVAHGHEIAGTAGNGLEALQQARALRPDLILMDIEMPVCDGLAATRLIRAEWPEAKIVMLTVSAKDEHLFEAIKSGASGYLLKSESSDRFLAMVDEVARGGAALPPALAARLLDEFALLARRAEQAPTPAGDDLTPRQTAILTLIAQGRTYAQAGQELFLAESTVRYHMEQAMARLHLQNRAQVIAYAARHGLSGSAETPDPGDDGLQ
jgi:DNA-binding NarL/FixJ family response regulator